MGMATVFFLLYYRRLKSEFSEFTSNAGEAFASLTDLVEYYMENKDLLKTNEGEKVSSFI